MTGSIRKQNKHLAKAISDARKSLIPENYIERVIQLAKLGVKEINIPNMILTGTARHILPYPDRIQITASGQPMNS